MRSTISYKHSKDRTRSVSQNLNSAKEISCFLSQFEKLADSQNLLQKKKEKSKESSAGLL
jgi:hypothetical protein